MKYLSTLLAGAFCGLFLLNSCSSEHVLEPTVPETGGENNGTEYSFVVKNFIRDTATDSRTAIVLPDDDTEGAGFIWTAGDSIGVVPNEGAQAYFVINSEGAGSSSATFSGGAWALKPDESSNYAAYYPLIGDFYLDRTKVPVDYRGQVYRPADENNNLTSLAPHDYMAAKPSVASSSSNVAFEFNHLGALVEVQFTPDMDGNIIEVALAKQEAVLPYRGSFDLTDEQIAITHEEGDYTAMIPVAVEDMEVTAGTSTSVFFMMPPVSVQDQQTYLRVKYEDGSTRMYMIKETKELEASVWYTLTTYTTSGSSVLNIADNSVFASNLADAIDETGATRIKFVTSSPVRSTISWQPGDYHVYAVQNGEWLELHTPLSKFVAAESASSMFDADNNPAYKNIVEIDFTGFDTSEVTNMSSMFSGCSSLTTLDLNGFIISSVTDMNNMFFGCSGLTTFTFGENFNTSAVTDMSYMFYGCSGLATLTFDENFSTSAVTDMSYMFSGCSGLATFTFGENFNTSAVTNMSYMFYGCSGLTALTFGENFSTSAVTDMNNMFSGCSSLTTLDVTVFNTSEVTDMNNMFSGCSGLASLDVTVFNTEKVTNMSSMFSDCSSLTTLTFGNGFITSSVTSMSYMFSSCSGLTALDLSAFNTSSVTDMSFMFYGCSGLTSLDVTVFNTSSVTNMGSMFSRCSSLTTLDLSSFDFVGVVANDENDGFWYMLDYLGSESKPIIVYVKDENDMETLTNSTAIDTSKSYVTLEVKN